MGGNIINEILLIEKKYLPPQLLIWIFLSTINFSENCVPFLSSEKRKPSFFGKPNNTAFYTLPSDTIRVSLVFKQEKWEYIPFFVSLGWDIP